MPSQRPRAQGRNLIVKRVLVLVAIIATAAVAALPAVPASAQGDTLVSVGSPLAPFSNFFFVAPIHDARHTSSRAASISIFMSASLNAMPWFSMIDRPNALRSLAYSSEYS